MNVSVILISSDNFYFDLKINGRSYFNDTSFEFREKLYQKALEKLDKDIESVAELNKEEHLGGFLWCFTYDLHRVDGVAGTVMYYYLFEILKDLRATYADFELKIRKVVPYFVQRVIKKEIGIPVKYDVSLYSRSKLFVRYKFGALRRLYFKSIENTNSSTSGIIEENSTIFFYNINSDFNRLRSFPEYLASKGERIYFFDLSLKYFKNYGADDIFQRSIFSLRYVVVNLLKVFLVKRLIKKTKFNLHKDSYFIHIISEQSYLQSFYMLYKKSVLEETFKKYRPNKVIVSTTIGDPVSRLVLNVAKKSGVYSTVFSCRNYLTLKRSEDRLIKPDVKSYNQAYLGDEFYVLDKISREHLIRHGYTGLVKLFNYKQYLNNKQARKYKDGVLILFAGESTNYSLIKLIEELADNKVYVSNLYYKEHPNVKITKDQLYFLYKISDKVVSVTGYKWANLEFENVLAVTCNTTASIEALNRGCSLLWLPFIFESSLQFSDIMNLLGRKVKSTEEAIIFIKQYIADSGFREILLEECIQQRRNYI